MSSRRLGQSTFLSSRRTSRRNWRTPVRLRFSWVWARRAVAAGPRSGRCQPSSAGARPSPASASSVGSWCSLAGAEGLEPPTAGFGDRCSTKLSYAPPPSLVTLRYSWGGLRKDQYTVASPGRGRSHGYPARTSMEARRPQLADLGVFLLVVAAPLVFTPFSESPFGDPKLVMVAAAALACGAQGSRSTAGSPGRARPGPAPPSGALLGTDPSAGSPRRPAARAAGCVVVVAAAVLLVAGCGQADDLRERGRRWFVAACAAIAVFAIAGPPRAGDASASFGGPLVRGRHHGQPALRRRPALGRGSRPPWRAATRRRPPARAGRRC